MVATAPPPSPVIDEATVDEFAATGAVIVRGLFNVDEVATIERGIERTLAAPSPRRKVASSSTDPGSFVEDFCNWQRIEEFRQVAFTSPAADVAAALTHGVAAAAIVCTRRGAQPPTRDEVAKVISASQSS